MTNLKYTERMFYNDLLNEEVVQNTPRYLEKVNALLTRLDNKNKSRSTKPTKNQLQNLEIKEKILEVLTEPMTATQLTRAVEPFFPELDITSNRITSILNKMGTPSEKFPDATGEVKREVIKRSPYYSRA